MYIETVVYTTPLSILKLWCINPLYVYGTMVYTTPLYIWKLYTTPLSIWKLWCINPLYVYGNYGLYNPFINMETMGYTTPLYIWKLYPSMSMETIMYSVYNPFFKWKLCYIVYTIP